MMGIPYWWMGESKASPEIPVLNKKGKIPQKDITLIIFTIYNPITL